MADVAAGTLVPQEKAKLRKVLRRSDLVLFTACAIVGLDSVAFAAEVGTEQAAAPETGPGQWPGPGPRKRKTGPGWGLRTTARRRRA